MKKFTATYFVVMRIVALVAGILVAISGCAMVGIFIASFNATSSMTNMATEAGADAGIFSMVNGVNYIILFFAIVVFVIAILDFVASGKFGKYSKMTDNELIANRKAILAWGIVLAITLAGTIIGLIAIIVCAILANNYITSLEKPATVQDEETKTNSPSLWEKTKSMFKPKLTRQNEQLEQAKAMYENNQISQEEYEALRKKILEIDN